MLRIKNAKTYNYLRSGNILTLPSIKTLNIISKISKIVMKGDHILVFMFQPFKGTWIQSLACFLSVGNTSASILHKIIMECIILTK
ncbi:hypothetical protein ACFW04_014441 [Cataglyphis niger]